MFEDSDIIHSVTRAQLINSGDLVDVTSTARQAGFKFPVALTRAVWSRYVEFQPGAVGQDEQGRLWDVLTMLLQGIRQASGDADRIDFKLYVAMPDAGNWQPNEQVPSLQSVLTRDTHRLVSLKALCGPGDNLEPVITILLPDED